MLIGKMIYKDSVQVKTHSHHTIVGLAIRSAGRNGSLGHLSSPLYKNMSERDASSVHFDSAPAHILLLTILNTSSAVSPGEACS